MKSMALPMLVIAGLAPSAGVLASSSTSTEPSAREAELEARIAELERLVREVLAERSAPVAAAPAAPAAPVAPAAPTIQTTPINIAGAPGTRFSFGGFIKLEALTTNTDGGEIPDGSNGRLLYIPGAIPVGAADEGTDFDASAQFSRFWLASDAVFDDGTPVRAYLEFDFFGSALGSKANTNTYGVTVRHAWASWGRWMAGQNWSNFQDPGSLVDSIDLIGATDATVFARQPQVRYTHGAWSLALESPTTTVAGFRGIGARITSADNRVPDFTARWTSRGDWGHLSVAGVLRELRYETTTGIEDTSAGYGLSVTGRRVLDSANDLRFGITGGEGINRYLGLGINADATLDASGNLDVGRTIGGFAGLRHVFSPKLRGNVYGSFVQFDNDTAITGSATTEKVGSIATNLIYTPYPRLDVGVEARMGRRWLESGIDGDLFRLHFHARYSF